MCAERGYSGARNWNYNNPDNNNNNHGWRPALKLLYGYINDLRDHGCAGGARAAWHD